MPFESGIYSDILQSPILVSSPNDAGDLIALLDSGGYNAVRRCETVDETAAVYERTKPRLSIIDVEGHGRDGVSLIESVVSREHEICGSVLAITPRADEGVGRSALNAGAWDIIERPLNPVVALSRIRNRLAYCTLVEKSQEENDTLEARIRVRTRELEASHLDLVHRLARAAEFRDSDTGQHIARMSLYAAELGRAAGLSEHECQLLLNASALHDIGKIGIADRVLLKPGAHTSEETRSMRTHVEMGVAILEGSEHELLQWAEIIASTHHERWDGTGYPKGLKGEEIPLIGRIVAICDVFDALTTVRPYKRPWTVEASVNEIRQGAGSHFEPRLVQSFLELVPRLTMIQNSYAAALSRFYS